MWLWLILSIIILAACIIFALRIFATSYNFIIPKPDEKTASQQTTKVLFSVFRQESSINELKTKIKIIEENYLAQFNKLQQRIDFLDNQKVKANKWKDEDDDGGWEELYYKTLKDKENAEEALDVAAETEETLRLRIKELENKQSDLHQIQAQIKDEQSGVQSLKNRIEMLQHEASAGTEREKLLVEEVSSLKKVKRDHELLQHLYAHLLTEADELKLRIHEITNRDISLTKKINRLNELESNFEISESEKVNLKKSVEEIITENEALSAKLQELQDKLSTERYA